MTKKMYNWAKLYQERGFIIIPLQSPKTDIPEKKLSKTERGRLGKKPLIYDFTQRKNRFSDKQLKKWFLKTTNNIGMLTGKVNDVIVIDFDEPDAIIELFKGIKIHTRHDHRKPGKAHYWFRYTKKLPRSATGYINGHKFQISSNRKQVVVPPSIHRDGQEYIWQDDDLEISVMPKKLLKRILRCIGSQKPVTYTNTPSCNKLLLKRSENVLNTKIKSMSEKQKLKRLNKIIYNGCRKWLQHMYADRAVIHKKKDSNTENVLLAIGSELKRNGAVEEDAQTFMKEMSEKIMIGIIQL
jgi:hypothetical protein